MHRSAAHLLMLLLPRACNARSCPRLTTPPWSSCPSPAACASSARSSRFKLRTLRHAAHAALRLISERHVTLLSTTCGHAWHVPLSPCPRPTRHDPRPPWRLLTHVPFSSPLPFPIHPFCVLPALPPFALIALFLATSLCSPLTALHCWAAPHPLPPPQPPCPLPTFAHLLAQFIANGPPIFSPCLPRGARRRPLWAVAAPGSASEHP